jgi:peptidoglycan/LPS O-acetylase OafA/YrhL
MGGAAGGRVELKPLTSLRFVAALMVFFHHFPPTQPFAQAHYIGEAGVGFFFLLSGFILTYTYHRDFAGPFSTKAAQRFHIARIARIYPVHLATMAICIAWFIPFGAPQWNLADQTARVVGTLEQALLLQSWSPNANIYASLNIVSWSISVEAFFYLLFPFMLYALLRALRGRSAAVVIAIGGALWCAQVVVLLSTKIAPLTAWALKYYPPVRMVDFLVGLLLGIAFLRRGRETWFGTPLEVSALASVVAMIAALPFLPESMRFSGAMMPLWGLMIFAYAVQRGAISRLLSRPWFIRLGEASFAFYMVHYVVLLAENRFFGWSNVAVSLAIGLSASIAASFILLRCVEVPMRRWITSRYRGDEVTPLRGSARAVPLHRRT